MCDCVIEINNSIDKKNNILIKDNIKLEKKYLNDKEYFYSNIILDDKKYIFLLKNVKSSDFYSISSWGYIINQEEISLIHIVYGLNVNCGIIEVGDGIIDIDNIDINDPLLKSYYEEKDPVSQYRYEELAKKTIDPTKTVYKINIGNNNIIIPYDIYKNHMKNNLYRKSICHLDIDYPSLTLINENDKPIENIKYNYENIKNLLSNPNSKYDLYFEMINFISDDHILIRMLLNKIKIY